MINSEEAKRLVNEARQIDLTRFENAIRNAAKNGESSVQVHLVNNKERSSIAYVIENLIIRGFQAKREQHSDFRESWDYLHISW